MKGTIVVTVPSLSLFASGFKSISHPTKANNLKELQAALKLEAALTLMTKTSYEDVQDETHIHRREVRHTKNFQEHVSYMVIF
jgi:hypothetical protein